MNLSLKAKLSAAFVAVTVCGIFIAGVLVDRNVRSAMLKAYEDRLSYQTTMLGQMTANALFGEIDPNDTSLRDSVKALGSSVHTQLSVIAKDGTITADSECDDPRALGPQNGEPEVSAASSSGTGVAVRDGRMFVATAIVREGATLGFARSSVPMAEVMAYVGAVRTRVAVGSLVALCVAIGLGLIFSTRIVRPIHALSEGARRVGAGDFEHPIEVTTHDELGELAVAFNDMTRSLRTTIAQLDGRNHDMRMVLDNVDQGLLTVDRAGAMSAERSAVVDTWFGPSAAGERFVDCLRRVDAPTADTFEMQWEELLEGTLPRALLLHQLPHQLKRGEKTYELAYTPITDAEDAIGRVLVVVSDVTARLAAQRAEAEQREIAAIFERILRDKLGALEFVSDAEGLVQQLIGVTRPPLTDTRRALHTLKGNASLYGMQRLSSLCHDIETRMAEVGADICPADREVLGATWRQTALRLATFLGDRNGNIVVDDDEYAHVMRSLLDGSPRAEVVRRLRDWKMERVGDRLDRLAHQARDIARRLHKAALTVEIGGAGLRLPAQDWSPFWAALPHVLRNAVDHGIEGADERRAAGKTEEGCLRLTASRAGGALQIEVSDDGRGVDWDKVAAKAQAAGLPTARHEDLVAALFAEGVSTRDAATETSGRGVGLGAAKHACERLGGYVTVESIAGRGTAFRFHMPLPERGPSLLPAITVPPAAAE
jgi:two-component system chemotaxis sensor kinase CheA